MSLFVRDTRRGRSKSPGRERSRSRSAKPPSPPLPTRPSKTKKYYEEDLSEENSEDDRKPRPSRQRHEEPRYEVAEPRHRRASSPVTHSTALTRGDKHTSSSDPHYEYDHRDGRQPSHAEPARREQDRPIEYTRHSSYSRPDEHSHVAATAAPSYAPPGQYKWEYDHPEEKSYRPPPEDRKHDYEYEQAQELEREREHHRHLSLNTSGSFNVNLGGGHPQQPHYVQPTSPHPQQSHYAQPVSPQYAAPPASSIYNQQPHHAYSQPPALHQAPAYAPPPSHSPPSNHPDHYRHNSGTVIAGRQQYATPERYQYAQPPQQITYTTKTNDRTSYTHTPQTQKTDGRMPYMQTPHAQILEVKPHNSALHAPPSPGLGPKMHRLSVSGGAGTSLTVSSPGGHHQGGLPPGSPLLEAYKGTYQSISPMGSPMMLPSSRDDDLSDLDALEHSSDDSQRRKPRKSILKKRVVIYDPEPDALALASALNHTSPDPKPIVSILPILSDDHIMAIRTEYKKHIKVHGKGINIAKHIKMKVPGTLGKIAYATALGRWEGEAHWANFWYQSGTSRRELLIESLMGRTNSEIRAIKQAFSDKRYNDSLVKCMETELKKDKFRHAVLLVLEEKKMEENAPISNELIRRDVYELHKALTSKEGGETAMISIVVVRNDTHMREVLRFYEATYKKNFAREMIQKSRNLVVSLPSASCPYRI